MSKNRKSPSKVAEATRRPTGKSLGGVPAVNLLLDPKLDSTGSPPLVALEQVGRRSVICASGVIILSAKNMEVEWVRAVIQRPQRGIPAKVIKKAPNALLLPVPGDPTQILYQFVDDRPNTQDCRIKGASLGLENRLLVYAKIRQKGAAKQFLAQTCLQFEGVDPLGNSVGPVPPIKEHTVSIPRGMIGGWLQKYRTAGGSLDECRGTANLPTPGIKEVAAYIYRDQSSANGPGDPPAGAKTIVYSSLMSEYKFKWDYYGGVYVDNRVPGVSAGRGNFLVVWAKFDGDPKWYRAMNTQNGLQFEGIS